MLSVSQNSVEQIRRDLFDKLQDLPIRYFDSNPTGEIMSRFTNDIDNIDIMLNNSLTSIVSGIITLIGTFVFMLTTNIWLTLVTVVFIPIFIILFFPAFGIILTLGGILVWRCWDKITDIAKRIHKLIYKTEMY